MRLVHISDTHRSYEGLHLPLGDILVHSGDFECFTVYDLIKFSAWINGISKNYKHVLLVPGNHDRQIEAYQGFPSGSLNVNITCLINQQIIIDGISFWGSPYTPEFFNWFFMKSRGPEIRKEWEKIPSTIDVVITHGPPKSILDKVVAGPNKNLNVGCEELADELFTRVKPKLVLFGHIHEGRGTFSFDGMKFSNACMLDERYRLTHKPIVWEISDKDVSLVSD